MNGKIRAGVYSFIWLATSLADCMWHCPIITLLLDQAENPTQNKHLQFCFIFHENSGWDSTSFAQELSEINTAEMVPRWAASAAYPTALTHLGCKWFFPFPCGWCQEPLRNPWQILRGTNMSSIIKVTVTMGRQGNLRGSHEGEAEQMAKEQVSVQWFYCSPSGFSRISVTLAQGPLTATSTVHSGRNEEVSLAFSKCSWG